MWVFFIILGAIFLYLWKHLENELLLYYDSLFERQEKADKLIEKEYKSKSKRNYILWLMLFLIWIYLVLI